MALQVAVLWDGPLLFTRLIEDCGHTCELVTPHLLAAPFFRRRLHGLVIPAGFACPGYTSVLAALRAIRPRIRRYVEEGGTVLAFGAGSDLPDAYDWLPVPVTYRYGFSVTSLKRSDHPFVSILEGETGEVSIDGTVHATGGDRTGQVILQAPEGPVMLDIPCERGRILVASLHEYPSHRFIREFCARESEGLL